MNRLQAFPAQRIPKILIPGQASKGRTGKETKDGPTAQAHPIRLFFADVCQDLARFPYVGVLLKPARFAFASVGISIPMALRRADQHGRNNPPGSIKNLNWNRFHSRGREHETRSLLIVTVPLHFEHR